MKHEFWTIAYRKREEKTILEDTKRPFRIIRNTWRYWAADPHLFEENGEVFVFAELYDRILRRGVIGYCRLTDNGYTPWRVALKMPFHLSYPHIFRQNDGIYMIPESYVGNEIAIYKAVQFPDQWEKIRVLQSDICAVDTTWITSGEQRWLLTYRLQKEQGDLMLMSSDGKTSWCIAENDPYVRPAGPIFRHAEEQFRPAQNCEGAYGKALRFYKVEEVRDSQYRESCFAELLP